MQHQARSIYDERISLLTQVSQALYVTAAAMHENPDDLCNTQNYTLVGYYDPDWKLQSEQDNALPPLGALNLSWDNLDAPPAGSPAERVCISREMAEASQISGISGSVHTLTLCD